MGPSPAADDLPHELRVGERTYVVARSTVDDVPAVVALLHDDELGAARESVSAPDLRVVYRRAFEEIDADPNQLLVVADLDGDVVGTMQLTYVPGLSRQGATRAIIESVRVAGSDRGRGIGAELIAWAIAAAREHGAVLVQLTSDRSRVDAHRFYERLGFTASHVGFKLQL